MEALMHTAKGILLTPGDFMWVLDDADLEDTCLVEDWLLTANITPLAI